VYCTGLLGSNVVGLLHPNLNHLLFYVSVCNLAPLNHLDAFVACKYDNMIVKKVIVILLFNHKSKITA